jgi:hypothetical protein
LSTSIFSGHIVQIDRVRRHVHACGNAVAEPFASVGVTRNLESLAMRFVHDRLGLLEREGGRVHHGAVGVQRVLLGAVDLDPLDAVVRVFPDGLAQAPWAVGNLGPEVANLLAAQQGKRDVGVVGIHDAGAGDLHPRALDDAGVDRVAEIQNEAEQAIDVHGPSLHRP